MTRNRINLGGKSVKAVVMREGPLSKALNPSRSSVAAQTVVELGGFQVCMCVCVNKIRVFQ